MVAENGCMARIINTLDFVVNSLINFQDPESMNCALSTKNEVGIFSVI